MLPWPLVGQTSTETYQWLLTTTPRFSRQPCSDISTAPSNTHFYPASPTYPARKTSTQKSECEYTTASGNLSRQKFAIHQKSRHSFECGKSIASKYDLSQHISRFHDNCPIICEICSKPFKNIQRFANHKIIKHPANSHKNISTPCVIGRLKMRNFFQNPTPHLFPG